jgi:hypothetical protein
VKEEGMRDLSRRAFGRHLVRLLALLAPLALALPGPVLAATTTHTSATIPVGSTAFSVFANPCSGVAGDKIVLTGNVALEIQTTIDDNGGVHMEETATPAPGGLSGVGTLSGVQYQAVGMAHFSTQQPGPPPVVIGQERNFRFISQGSEPNLLLTFELHETVNANGVVTVLLTNLTATCAG